MQKIIESFVSWLSGSHGTSNLDRPSLIYSDLNYTNVRLPTHAIPEKYVIHLTPFIIPDNFTIEGHVSIDIDVNKDANNITLHIKGQEISEENCCVFNRTTLILFSNFVTL